jgi:NAD(P)-dependent dehydrogenase (short-subunit alcohol dehydrogenase family)
VLVNNAGIAWTGPALDMPLDVLQTMLRVNVEGVLIVRRAILPHMITQRLGSVVNLASWAGKTGNAYFVGYSASKLAVIALTQYLAPEMTPYGIRVNAICPDIAADYARRRTAFGKPLGEHEGVGFMLADNAMDIHQSRLVICPRTAGPVGPFRGSEAIWRVVDRSMQILGGLGITDDTIVARLFHDIRPFRIYDGPSEVHRWSIARRVLRAGNAGA